MSALVARAYELLCDLLESPQGQVAPGLVDEPDDVAALAHLVEIDAASGDASGLDTILCPSCSLHAVEPLFDRTTRRICAVCAGCGRVQVRAESLKVVTLNLTWVINRLMRAFAIDSRQRPHEMVPGLCWRLGEKSLGTYRYKLIVVRRLADRDVRRQVSAAWPGTVGADRALVLSVSSADEIMALPAGAVLIPLRTVFHLRSTALELDEALLDGCLRARMVTTGSHIFSDGFRTATLNGHTYSFTPMQASFLRFLHEQDRVCNKHEIMEAIESKETEPRNLFRTRNTEHMSGFVALVGTDKKGNFWLRQ